MSEQKPDELEQYRSQIDVLDRRLLDLLNERTAIVEQIGRVKQERKLGRVRTETRRSGITPTFSLTITGRCRQMP